MDEAFDHAFEGDEAMEGELMDKIYDEIGIEFAAKVSLRLTGVTMLTLG